MSGRVNIKRIVLSSTIGIITIGSIFFVCDMYGFANGVKQDTQSKLKWQVDNIAIYFVNLPEGLDTIEFKASVMLDKNKAIHKIEFPGGSTSTTVLICDEGYLKQLQEKNHKAWKPLIKVVSNQIKEYYWIFQVFTAENIIFITFPVI